MPRRSVRKNRALRTRRHVRGGGGKRPHYSRKQRRVHKCGGGPKCSYSVDFQNLHEEASKFFQTWTYFFQANPRITQRQTVQGAISLMKLTIEGAFSEIETTYFSGGNRKARYFIYTSLFDKLKALFDGLNDGLHIEKVKGSYMQSSVMHRLTQMFESLYTILKRIVPNGPVFPTMTDLFSEKILIDLYGKNYISHIASTPEAQKDIKFFLKFYCGILPANADITNESVPVKVGSAD